MDEVRPQKAGFLPDARNEVVLIEIQVEDGIAPQLGNRQEGSTPIPRTLQLSPIMGQEECHATAEEVQRRVQA